MSISNKMGKYIALHSDHRIYRNENDYPQLHPVNIGSSHKYNVERGKSNSTSYIILFI